MPTASSRAAQGGGEDGDRAYRIRGMDCIECDAKVHGIRDAIETSEMKYD